MKKFEYKSAHDLTDQIMNIWGANGWECYAAVPAIGGYIKYLFKKEILT